MTNRIAKSRLALGVAAVVAGGLAGVYGQPLIHGNEVAINVIVTVFSILAGFLIAIMSIMGDPAMLLPGGWRIAKKQSDLVRKRLNRQKYLFYLYLVTLGLVFLSMLIKDVLPELVIWLERLYLGLSVSGFILSLRLPGALMALQQDRVQFVVSERKKQSGIDVD